MSHALPVGIGEPRTLLRIIYRVSRVPVGAPGLGHMTPKGPLLRGFYQGNSNTEEARIRAPCCVPRENCHPLEMTASAQHLRLLRDQGGYFPELLSEIM